MTGEALTVIGRLYPYAALDYNQLKTALLQRFRCTSEGYREKFRQASPEDNKAAMHYSSRLASHFDHWVELQKAEKSYDSHSEMFLTEPFVKGCSPELRVFLKEGSCLTLKSCSQIAAIFMEARMLQNLSQGGTTKTTVASASKTESGMKTARDGEPCFQCDKAGNRADDELSRRQKEVAQHISTWVPRSVTRRYLANL